MKHHVTVHQLSTGHGAFLNVRDLHPGLCVWGCSLNPETQTDTPVAALALEQGQEGEIVLFALVVADNLGEFNRWLVTEATHFTIIYLITPQGLQVVSKLQVTL